MVQKQQTAVIQFLEMYLLLEVVLVETITDLSLGTKVDLVEALATLQMALLEELAKARPYFCCLKRGHAA